MFKLSLVVFCALVAAAVAYNFDNPDFNNFLLGDFEEVRSPITKRDTEEHHYRHHYHHHHENQPVIYCCKGDKIDPKAWEPLIEMRRECMVEIFGKENVCFQDYNPFDCKQMAKLKSDLICLINCIARKADVIDEEGAINEIAVRHLVKSHVEGSKWQVAAADKVLDKCLAEEYNDEKDGECSVAPVKLLHCVWSQFIHSCPAKLHDNSEACKKIRIQMNAGGKNHHHSDEVAFHPIFEDLERYV